MRRRTLCPVCNRRHYGNCRYPAHTPYRPQRLVAEVNKPPAACEVCDRSDRAAIEEKMRAGTQLGVIVELFGLEHSSVKRHRDEHLKFGRVQVAPPEPESGRDWDTIFGETGKE